MTDALADLRALAEQATPRAQDALLDRVIIAVPSVSMAAEPQYAKLVADTAFIAAASPAVVLSLVEVAEAAQRVMTSAHPGFDEAMDDLYTAVENLAGLGITAEETSR